MSEILGKETIDMLNTGESRGQSSSYSMNYQRLGKELMSQDEIAVMDGSKCILQVRGVRPFLSTKYDITQHHNYQYLSDADADKIFDIADFVEVFKKNKEKLLEDVNKQNANIVVIEITADDDAGTENDTTAKGVAVSASTPAATQEFTPTETANTPILTAEPASNQIGIKTDNDEGDEDDSDYFYPDDTELV